MRYTLLLIVLLCSTAFNSMAQGDRSMQDILTKIKESLDIIEKRDYEPVRFEADIIRTEKVTYRTLSTGWNYGIFALGSDRVKDIDIEVFRKNDRGDWYLVVKDTDHESTAHVNIKPEQEGEYMIKIKVHEFNKGQEVGHYGLVVYHE